MGNIAFMGKGGYIEFLGKMCNGGYVEALGLITCGLLSIMLVKRWGSRNEKFPPGPFAWPIIGHLHLFRKLPHRTLRDLSKRYGHIVGLRLGQQRAVAISSPELAKEVLLTHDKVFANRPHRDFTAIVLYGSIDSIIYSPYGPQWRKQRRICTMRLFTAKRLQELEYVRQEEMAALLHSIHEASAGGSLAVDLGRCAGQMSSRLIMRLLQSKATVQVGGENLQDLIKEAEHEVTSPTFGDLIPWLSFLDFVKKRRMRRLHARLDTVLMAMLAERKQSTSHHDDLLDALLSEEEALSMDQIKSIIHDMIAAGIHTTSLTLEWAMAELLRNPHCIQRLQQEIEAVLGKKKQVSDADLPNLSYLKCIVKEVFRLHPVAPLLVPRISSEECKVQGYTLPANTHVFVNVWAIGRDEQVWPNAKEFIPERFQGKDIELKGQNFELLPFGSGRRACLGLPLALSTIEVTLTNLVNRFDWELPCGETPTSINMDEKKGLTNNKVTPVMAIPKPRFSS